MTRDEIMQEFQKLPSFGWNKLRFAAGKIDRLTAENERLKAENADLRADMETALRLGASLGQRLREAREAQFRVLVG